MSDSTVGVKLYGRAVKANEELRRQNAQLTAALRNIQRRAAAELPSKPEAASTTVDAIIADIRDRKGLKQEWNAIDADIQDEIRTTWIAIINQAIDHAIR